MELNVDDSSTDGRNGVLLLILLRLLVVIVAIVAIVFVVITVYIAWVHRRYQHLPGPPYTNFYLGHMPAFWRMLKRGNFSGVLFHEWAEQYGPVVKVFIMHRVFILITGPSLVKEFLTKSKHIKSPRTYTRLNKMLGMRFLGTGILTDINHERWHEKRSALNPAFHKKYLRMFMDQFNEVGDNFLDKLSTLVDSQSYFSMHAYLCRITLDAITEVGFNYKMNALESDDNIYLVHIMNALRCMSRRIRDPFFEFRPSEKAFRKNAVDSIKFLRALGQKLLNERQELMKSGEPVPDDIQTYIIKCKESMPDITDEDVLDDFMTFFIAGQETTANALSFLFCEVGRRPEIYQKLQKEIDTVLEGRSQITYEDLSRLEYTGQVFKETLRLYPPAPGTSRENVEDITIDGFMIPAKTHLVFPFYGIHRLSKFYDDPEDFKPERFSSDAERVLFTYMPFSLGHRSCIGQQFAQIESKVLIAKFFQKFNFKVDPDQSFGITENATLRPTGGTMMTISLRS